MRLFEVSRAPGELPADGLAAGNCGSPTTAQADQVDLAAGPRPDWPRRDQPDGSRSLAERLARLPEAHPSAWSGADRTVPERSAADWAGPRTSGEPDGAYTWWQGESDIWWRIPGRSAGEADCDDGTGGLDDRGELADSDDLTGTGRLAEGASAADADAAGETGDQGSSAGGEGGRPARPAPGAATPGHGTRDGRWGGAGLAGPDQSGPDRGPYRPWFSADASGEPWFAAGRQDRADS